jgi:hypothetical protein
LATTGGDLTSIQAELISILNRLGADTNQVGQFTIQVKALGAVLKANPNLAESTAIANEIEKFIKSFEIFIASQLGLENFLTDIDILLDAQFSEFNKMFAAIALELNNLKSNAGFALEFFTTKINIEYARFVMVMIEASKNAAIKKGLTSKYW